LRNELIQQVNDQLPQPFISGTDEIEQRLEHVVFRLPSDIDLGYLQLIPSPWNEETHAVLAVTGTTDESVNRAIDVLTLQPWKLERGNLALVRGEDVKTIDTRKLMQSGIASAIATTVQEVTPTVSLVITATPEITPFPSPLNPTPDIAAIEQTTIEMERPAWLLPLVGITVFLVVVILVFAFWQARRQAKKS